MALMVLAPVLLRAQLFEGEEYEYSSEWIWGLNKNSRGGLIGGVVLRFNRTIGDDFFESYGLELSNVKHPSERRYTGQTGAGYSFPKLNYLYAIRLQYGREKLLFRKANQQGVQVSTLAMAGPSIALEAPYYLNKIDGTFEQYTLGTSPDSYIGPGKLLQGIDESKVVPGLNVKASLIFEFGTYKSNVAGLETGVMIEGFTRKIIIVPTQPNDFIFTSVFLNLFWGTRK